MDVANTMANAVSGKPGIVARDVDGDSSLVEVSTEGIFANGGNVAMMASSSGIGNGASVVGILRNRSAGSSLIKSINAGVAGLDNSTESSYSEGYGGYFNKLYAGGLILDCISTTSSKTLSQLNVMVSCYNTSTITITLPSTKYVGQTFLVRRCNAATVTVNGNGTQIVNSADTSTSINVGGSRGDMGVFIYDGSYWLYNYLPRNS
jgi:hypothetical protein